MQINLEQNAKVSKAHITDSGVDLYPRKGFTLKAKEYKSVKVGVSVELPKPMMIDDNIMAAIECHVRGRSGLAKKKGILAHFGTIDNDYTGEIEVVLFNLSDKDYKFTKDTAIAQLVFNTLLIPIFDNLKPDTDEVRGSKGFGSSDKEKN